MKGGKVPRAFFGAPWWRLLRALACALALAWPGVGRAEDARSAARRHYENGVAREREGEFKDAIGEFDRAIDADGRNALYFAARGNARTNIGDSRAAIDDFSRAIEISPGRWVPYVNRGVARVDLGDLDGAIADYSKAIDLDPKSAAAYVNRGCARQEKGDLEGARGDFSQAIQLARDDAAYPRFYLYLLIMRQRSSVAPMELKSVVAGWPNGWKKTVGLFLAGELDETALLARAEEGTAREVRAQRCEGNYYAGALRLLHGDTPGARAAFEKCVATQQHTFPEFQMARAELAGSAK